LPLLFVILICNYYIFFGILNKITIVYLVKGKE
jgi:hypothetical protein